ENKCIQLRNLKTTGQISPQKRKDEYSSRENCPKKRVHLAKCRKMGSVFISILLTCVFLLVGKFFFSDFVEYVFCAFELVFFSFFYSYYSKDECKVNMRHTRWLPSFVISTYRTMTTLLGDSLSSWSNGIWGASGSSWSNSIWAILYPSVVFDAAED
ncbi:hypothetical protein STEG23_026488, partial [Scotinomys teguina]